MWLLGDSNFIQLSLRFADWTVVLLRTIKRLSKSMLALVLRKTRVPSSKNGDFRVKVWWPSSISSIRLALIVCKGI